MKTKICDLLVRWIVSKTSSGKIIFKREKPRKASPSRSIAQRDHQDRFRMAAAYASNQMRDAETKAMYETGINKKKNSAYAVAISDALNAPKVHEIDTVGYEGAVNSIIAINASDDFRVVSVNVTIQDPDGKLLETGEAIQHPFNRNLWSYTTTVKNSRLPGSTISATAYDLPGNETTLSKVLERSTQTGVAFDKRVSKRKRVASKGADKCMQYKKPAEP
jgi:hypothetical protein